MYCRFSCVDFCVDFSVQAVQIQSFWIFRSFFFYHSGILNCWILLVWPRCDTAFFCVPLSVSYLIAFLFRISDAFKKNCTSFLWRTTRTLNLNLYYVHGHCIGWQLNRCYFLTGFKILNMIREAYATTFMHGISSIVSKIEYGVNSQYVKFTTKARNHSVQPVSFSKRAIWISEFIFPTQIILNDFKKILRNYGSTRERVYQHL